MAEITHNDKKFVISDEIQAQYNELVDLILKTDSMDDNERQYWFDIMPSMTDEQIDRLFNILDTERKKLQELEEKYQEEIKELNEKHLIEWQDFQMKDSKKKIKEEEAKDKDSDADEVLNMLNDL
jgi:Spy/CpxP family protein refolding chaperone